MKQKPLLHVFRHIHGGHGKETAIWDSFQQACERVMDNESRWINLAKLVCYGIVGTLTGRH